jgi:hypothetical protein
MLRFRNLAAVAAAAVSLSGAAIIAGPGTPPSAAGDRVIGKQVLDMMCGAKDGTEFFTPMTISRCQEARARDNFELEQLICEGLLGGDFESVSSAGRPSRVNWFCFHGPVAP